MSGIEFFLAFTIFILASLTLWLYVLHVLFFIISIYSAKCMHKRSSNPIENPGVSILKPLMGVDSCLRENLISHFTLKYPTFELIFCVQDENDPVIDLVQSLRDQYPQVDSRLLIGSPVDIVNPLVSNMVPGYAVAKHDLLWVTTSKIWVSTDMLLDLVEKALPADVGLVHQPPFYADQPNFMGVLEKVCFGCSIMRNQLALNQLGMICFVGMSYILKKSLIEDLGGLAYYGKYLAEDFFIATDIHNKGYRLVVSNYPAQQNLVTANLSVYTNRMVRWLRLRLNMIPVVAAFLEPLCEPLNLGCLFSMTLHYLFDIPFLPVLIIHITVWIVLDYILLRGVQHTSLQFTFPTFVAAWLVRELLSYWIFFRGIWNPSQITWGKHTYNLQMGGLTQRLPSKSSPDLQHDTASKLLPTLTNQDKAEPAPFATNIAYQHEGRVPGQSSGRHHLVSLQYYPRSHSVFEDEEKLIGNSGAHEFDNLGASSRT